MDVNLLAQLLLVDEVADGAMAVFSHLLNDSIALWVNG